MKMGESGSEAYFYLAFALHSAEPQQWKRALEAAQKAIQLGPDDPWARILAGRIAKQAAQYDVALAFLTEATRMAPELAQAHFWLGSTYLAMGKAAEGQREMEEVDHLHVQNPARFDTEDWGLSRRLFALSR